MRIISDLQIHSKYSRAVSPKMTLPEIEFYARKKGINLVATGDWQHPQWFQDIKENLEETTEGIFSLRETKKIQNTAPECNVKFFLSSELSSIYKQGDKVRKIHNLIFSPSIDTCEKVINALKKRGANLAYDGRPIIGIPSNELLEMLLNIDEKIMMIPAHVWTPWFGLYGSKSGFDSIEECFGELEKYIYAIETGLSSDPLMTWNIKDLENRNVVSFSDAHSAPKMGREATVFQTKDNKKKDYSYLNIIDAIKNNPASPLKIAYTIEFYPQEGKYHWSGHRACNIRYSAEEIRKYGEVCPVCHKRLTIGVENRTQDLSQTSDQIPTIEIKGKNDLIFIQDRKKKRRPYISLIPLLEVLIETHKGSKTKAQRAYDALTQENTEFNILLDKDLHEIEILGGKELRLAIENVRQRKVSIDPGYDGVFGKVNIVLE